MAKKQLDAKPLMTLLAPEVQQDMQRHKDILARYQEAVLKEIKECIGLAVLPPPREVPGLPPLPEDQKNKVGILVVVDVMQHDKDGWKLRDKYIQQTIDIAKKTDETLLITLMDVLEIREACFDAKYDLLDAITFSAITYDPQDLLKALKLTNVHKDMVMKKFDKYIVSYVCVGSLFRGDATSHDIDVAIVIDDTDVKKMTRTELKDKLGAIIRGFGFEASQRTDVKKEFHIQTYILTDFWDYIKDASPVIYTFLRDGVPIYDRGVFMPWKLLLRMGRIRPSPEAIDLQMDTGERLLKRTKEKMLLLVGEDLHYAILNPAQAALMLYGVAPPTPKETVQLMDEIFVKREKLLEPKYVTILENIRKYYKDIEHRTITEITGKELDKLLKDAEDYFKRINKLFDQIQKQRDKQDVYTLYQTCVDTLKDVLALHDVHVTAQTNLAQAMQTHLIKKHIIPAHYLNIFKDVHKLKNEFTKGKIKHHEIEKTRKQAHQLIRVLVDYVQRKRGYELERARIRFKHGEKYGEALLLDTIAFIIPDIDAQQREISQAVLTPEGGLGKVRQSTLEELEKALAVAHIPEKVFIKEKIFEDLKKLFGNDVEILLHR